MPTTAEKPRNTIGCHFLVCFRLVTMAKNAASATAGFIAEPIG